MLTSFTFWLIVSAILIAYLCLSVGLRLRAEAARQRAYDKEHPGRAFDTSAIAPQIERVRQEYATAAQSRARDAWYLAGLLANARRFVTGLWYFRRGRPEHEFQKHDA